MLMDLNLWDFQKYKPSGDKHMLDKNFYMITLTWLLYIIFWDFDLINIHIFYHLTEFFL